MVKYFITLFSPETYEAFSRSDRSVSGHRSRHRNMASRVQPGDRLVCYLTKLSRWVGILEVLGEPYEDDTPIFCEGDDPFVIRFRVRPLIWLPKEQAVPIHDQRVWNTLSFTRGLDPKSYSWTGKLRGSLVRLEDDDGEFLERFLLEQSRVREVFPIDEHQYAKLVRPTVRRTDKVVTVSVPDSAEAGDEEPLPVPVKEIRESRRIQALLADIGTKMGMKIWLPRADRAAVMAGREKGSPESLKELPLNYDETTLRIIEQIDVLWLKGRAIVRAFEVEHTTSIHSGILRMADLLALQPNMDISLHIVAPLSRRDKVMQELRRPVFSLLEKGPLYKRCTYISYDSVRKIAQLEHLAYLSDSVLEEYAEKAD